MKHSDQVRTRREFIDYDYVNQLSPEERKFLAKFTDEYYGGAILKGDKNAIHYSDDPKEYDRLRKDCYNRNNEISRCQYNLSRTTAKMHELIEAITTIDKLSSGGDYEAFLIRLEDLMEKENMSEEQRKQVMDEVRDVYLTGTDLYTLTKKRE